MMLDLLLAAIGLFAVWKLISKPSAPTQGPRRQSDSTMRDRFLRDLGIEPNAGLAAVVLGAGFLCGTAAAIWLPSGFGAVRFLLPAVACWVSLETLRWRASRRSGQLEDGLAVGLDVAVAALAAGSTLERAFQVAAPAVSEPARGELLILAKRLARSETVEEASQRLETHYLSEGGLMLRHSLATAQFGSRSLISVAESVRDSLESRRRDRERASAEAGGVWSTAILVVLLPYVLLPVYAGIRPAWLEVLAEHPSAIGATTIAFLLQLTGLYWLRTLTRRVS